MRTREIVLLLATSASASILQSTSSQALQEMAAAKCSVDAGGYEPPKEGLSGTSEDSPSGMRQASHHSFGPLWRQNLCVRHW